MRFPVEIHEGKPVLYEFEKVKMSVFKGFDKVEEKETWELKRIYWNTLRFHGDTSEDTGIDVSFRFLRDCSQKELEGLRNLVRLRWSGREREQQCARGI